MISCFRIVAIERDAHLDDQLLLELSGVPAWLVDGYTH